MGETNVLLIVWDACRVDTAWSVARNLRELAAENLLFENAIAPAGQSLGSHVSMMTGKYPHEHGIYRQTDFIESPLSLIAEMDAQGYDRYAVSANGFAAPKYGFDRGFDEFYNTQGLTIYPDALDVHRYARQIREENNGTFTLSEVSLPQLLQETFGHDRPLKSFANVATAGLSEVVNRYPALQRVPHRRFDKYNEFGYDPEQNTNFISRIFETVNRRDRPFFLFTNYMDAHHPYAPPRWYQRQQCNQTFSYRELSRIAEQSHPFNYLERKHTGDDLSEEQLQTIRCLYTGEVQTADEHLGRLIEALEAYNLREETLIVVTADHGENLGETDQLGEQHMGHVRSASESHLRVPLVVAHPALEGATVEEYISVKNLYQLFSEKLDSFESSDEQIVDALRPDDGIVASEVPRTTTTALGDKYPNLDDILQRHLSVTYADGWKVVVGSNGMERAWKHGNEAAVEKAPERAVERARTAINQFIKDDQEAREISEIEKSQLEALGYL